MRAVHPAGQFEGPSGVYYDPEMDRLWWLERGEMAFAYDEKRNLMKTYNRYHTWTEGINGDLLVITGPGNLIYIGEL